MLLKVIACEIAFREFCHCAARTRNLIDLEFLTQGHHDAPCQGRHEIQRRIDAVPAGRYDAIVLGYGLCGQILSGLSTTHTRLVVPRAHDCISLFLGSKERYQELFAGNPGTYYFTSGWLECGQRRGANLPEGNQVFMPAHSGAGLREAYEQWVQKYGEERANYLREVLGQWTSYYNRGVLIDYEFTRPLNCREQVQKICAERGWEYGEVAGDLGLFQRLLDGEWNESEVLTVRPGDQINAKFDDRIIEALRIEKTGRCDAGAPAPFQTR
jgi:hypothetical protein